MRKILILFLFVLVSCKKEPFINNFNQIDHYQLTNESIEDSEKGFMNVIFEDYPIKISDTTFFNRINNNYWKINSLNKNKVDKFKKVFNKKDFSCEFDSACIPMYRDIYVLKENKKVTGILKVCYECEMYYFIGQNDKNQKIVEGGNFNSSIIENILK